MIGAGTLMRIVGKVGGPLLDRLGILPPRWYLHDALQALSEDDIPRVIRCLKRGGGRKSERWELIRQQAVFRCRVLNETHTRALQRLEKIGEVGCLQKTPENDLRQAIELHRLAIRILSGYEESLQRLIA